MTRTLRFAPALFRLLSAALLVWLSLPATLAAEYRTFTNEAGATIEARLVRVEDDLVVIERKDRQLFRFPIDQLSGEDQKYVRRWPALQALGSSDRVEIRLRRSRVGRNQERASPHVDPNLFYRRTEEEFVYQIILNNRVNEELRDVTIEYRIFKQRAAHLPGDRGRRIVRRGKVTAERVPARRETTLETEPFVIIDTDREEWGPFNPRIRDYPVVRIRRTDTLDGIWIRIMDGDKVVREEVSSQTIPRRFNW